MNTGSMAISLPRGEAEGSRARLEERLPDRKEATTREDLVLARELLGAVL